MKTKEQQLLKHFAGVLRNRANGNDKPISTSLLKYLSRKDFIEVIKKVQGGVLPEGLDVSFMENEELLHIIKDEMYVIVFVTEKWSSEQEFKTLAHAPVISKSEAKKSIPVVTVKDKK